MLPVFIRAIILYVLVMFCMRLMGKRQLGELQPSELVITILISNIASLPIEDTNIPLILGAIPVLVLVGFEIIISNVSLQSKGFRQFVSGRPIVIISNGIVDQKKLRQLRFSIDDLMESMRQNNIFDIREVSYAIVETTGKVSILQKFQSQTITPKMLDINGADELPPTIVISDGKIVASALDICKIDNKALLNMVAKSGFLLKEIFLMTIDSDKKSYIIKKEK